MTPRGAVLLEVLLSLAIFVGAAAFALSAARSAFTALHRADRRLQAVDLARSVLAELEAGLITLSDIREDDVQVGSRQRSLSDHRESRWTVEASINPSEHAGLSLVEIMVRERSQSDAALGYTLRQLVPIREDEAAEYETDELLRGLEGAR